MVTYQAANVAESWFVAVTAQSGIAGPIPPAPAYDWTSTAYEDAGEIVIEMTAAGVTHYIRAPMPEDSRAGYRAIAAMPGWYALVGITPLGVPATAPPSLTNTRGYLILYAWPSISASWTAPGTLYISSATLKEPPYDYGALRLGVRLNGPRDDVVVDFRGDWQNWVAGGGAYGMSDTPVAMRDFLSWPGYGDGINAAELDALNQVAEAMKRRAEAREGTVTDRYGPLFVSEGVSVSLPAWRKTTLSLLERMSLAWTALVSGGTVLRGPHGSLLALEKGLLIPGSEWGEA